MSLKLGTTDIAGIPTGLIDTVNGKADANNVYTKSEIDTTFINTSASNLNAQGKSLISGLGMPSNRNINLTLGASGTEYTAPANGWVSVMIQMDTSQGYLSLANLTGHTYFQSNESANGYLGFTLPCRKNDVFRVSYSHWKSTNSFRFVYAEGEENE